MSVLDRFTVVRSCLRSLYSGDRANERFHEKQLILIIKFRKQNYSSELKRERTFKLQRVLEKNVS